MTPGLRTYKAASCRVAIPVSLPEEMHTQVRELLSIKSDERRQGHASGLMHQVCTEADFGRIVLFINVVPFDDGLTIEQLKRFYSKHGFSEIQKDPCLMSRVPQRPKIVRVH